MIKRKICVVINNRANYARIKSALVAIKKNSKLELQIEAIRTHGRVWKYKGEAFVKGKKMADALWSATIVDKK